MGYIVDIDSIRNVQALFLKSDSDVPVPDYDLTELEQQLHDDAIARLDMVNPNHRYMAFGFITDLHESYNNSPYSFSGTSTPQTSRHALRLLGAIGKSYGLDAVFFGGDYSTGATLSYDEYSAALNELIVATDSYITVPHFAVEGNHDRWYDSHVDRCRGNSTWRQFLNRFNTSNRAVFPDNTTTNGGSVANTYYVDFPSHKVRVIMRSQYEYQETDGNDCQKSAGVGAGAFNNNLNDCLTFANPSDASKWTVLCVSHYSVSNEYTYTNKCAEFALRRFFNGDINDGNTGKGIVGEIFGHVHFETSVTHQMNNDGNLVRLSQMNAFTTRKDDPNEYKQGSYRFSIYVIDTTNGLLHEIKVGYMYHTDDNEYYNPNTGIFSYPFRHNEPVQSNNTFRFLHFSDVHDCGDSINKCKELLLESPDIKFSMFTGDLSNKTNYTYYLNSNAHTAFNDIKENNEISDKLLMVVGNHDAYDTWSGGNVVNAKNNIVRYVHKYFSDMMTNTGIQHTDGSSRWYLDYALDNGSKLRIITIDQYEIGADVFKDFDTNNPSKKYFMGAPTWNTVYTQEQVDWFIGLLRDLNPDDYFIVACHTPPVYGGTSPVPKSANEWCSSNLTGWGGSASNGGLWADIINAYLHHTTGGINKDVYNLPESDPATTSVHVEEDFNGITPCTFIGYLCGHIHGDLCKTHPVYPDQLIMCVDWGNDATTNSSNFNKQYMSDIYNSSSPHRKDGVLINDVTINFGENFDAPKITINRIGNGSGEDGYPTPSSGVPRDTITFSFNGETWVTE